MTRLEYELLMIERPELPLPRWTSMLDFQRKEIEAHTIVELVTTLTARKLAGKDSSRDCVNPFWPHLGP